MKNGRCGSLGGDRKKTPIPISSQREKVLGVSRKQKINLEKVLASLDTVCPKCGYPITPDKILRIDSQRIMCPKCNESFVPEKRGGLGQ